MGKTLSFFKAKTIKKIVMTSKVVKPGEKVCVARWFDIFVVAINNDNFVFFEPEEAKKYIKTIRENNHVIPEENAPVISTDREEFKFVVENGVLKEDSDETVVFSVSCKTFEEAKKKMGLIRTTFDSSNQYVKLQGPCKFLFYRHSPHRYTYNYSRIFPQDINI